MGNPTINNNGDISFGTVGSSIADSASSAWNSLTGSLKEAGGAVSSSASTFFSNLGKLPGGGGGFGYGGFVPPQPESPKFNQDRSSREPPPPTKSVAQQKQENSPKAAAPLIYPLQSGSKFKLGIQIARYLGNFDPFDKPKLNIQADIFLPIPDNLVEKYQTKIADTELGGLGALATASAGNLVNSLGSIDTNAGILDIGSQLAGKLQSAGSQFLQQAMQTNAKDLTKFAAIEAAKTAGLGGIVEAGIGVAVNPNVAAVFKGMNLREHSFKWKFYPRNREESEQIKKIIGKLRKAMLPEVSQGIGVIFNYPSVFKLNIFPEDNPYLYRFKTCFLENMEANYSPSGPAFHRNGAPAEITLSLQFQEIVVFTANDFNEDGEFIINGMSVQGINPDLTQPPPPAAATQNNIAAPPGAPGTPAQQAQQTYNETGARPRSSVRTDAEARAFARQRGPG